MVPATTGYYTDGHTLSLHDALPILGRRPRRRRVPHAVQRGARRDRADPRRTPRRVRRPGGPPRPDRMRPAHRPTQHGARDPHHRRRQDLGRVALETLFDAWWSTSHAMQKLRDDPECADEEFAAARRFDAPGLQPKLSFDPADDVAAPYVNTGARPRVAILREQGVNGQIEMASAFVRSGFEAVRSEEHTSELQSPMRISSAA